MNVKAKKMKPDANCKMAVVAVQILLHHPYFNMPD
jgi:hypothetical protein